MNARAQPVDHAGQVVVGARAQRSSAERHAVGPRVDGIQHLGVIGLRRHDPGQAQQRERRIVRMATEPHAQLFRQRRDLAEEIDEIAAQALGVDAVVLGQVFTNAIDRKAFGGARQAAGNVVHQSAAVAIGHGMQAPLGRVTDLAGEAFPRAGSRQQEQVEGGEIDQVEAHGGAAVRQPPGEVGAGPVEHRHEVVADHADVMGGEVAEALAVVVDVRAPIAALFLDVLRYRQAFDHIPLEPGRPVAARRRNLAHPFGDGALAPDLAGGHVMQGRDDPLGVGLQNLIDGNRVGGPEPSPCQFHIVPVPGLELSVASFLAPAPWLLNI